MGSFGRRAFIRGAVVLLGSAALASCTRPTQPEPAGQDSEPRTLPIPPVLEGSLVDGVRVFELSAQAGVAELLAGVSTPTWGFNGPHMGPTLLMRRGEQVRMQVTNDLDEMTAVHWHGMKLPAKADGGPHSPIEPGETWTAEFTVDQPAATLWYHPHPHMKTALHCYRGLAGALLIDDPVTDSLALPHTYGVDDIPVVITDQKFTEDGHLDEVIDPDLGLMGTTPLINGQANVKLDAQARRLRLRVLNGAGMRFYNVAFSDGRPFSIVATDSGLLNEPVEVEYALLGPAERVEIIVDLEPGEEVTLRSDPLSGNFGIPEGNNKAPDFGFQHSFDLLAITGPEGGAAPGQLPVKLDPAAAAVPSVDRAPEREFLLNTFQINGLTMDMERVDVEIDHDGPEVWTVTNENPDWPHNFHIHDARFRILELTGTDVAQVGTYGWKDTVAIPPGATVRLAVEFGHFPDPTIPYMFHCHMLLHEDQGMMGQFVIVEPGEEAELGHMGHH